MCPFIFCVYKHTPPPPILLSCRIPESGHLRCHQMHILVGETGDSVVSSDEDGGCCSCNMLCVMGIAWCFLVIMVFGPHPHYFKEYLVIQNEQSCMSEPSASTDHCHHTARKAWTHMAPCGNTQKSTHIYGCQQCHNTSALLIIHLSSTTPESSTHVLMQPPLEDELSTPLPPHTQGKHTLLQCNSSCTLLLLASVKPACSPPPPLRPPDIGGNSQGLPSWQQTASAAATTCSVTKGSPLCACA